MLIGLYLQGMVKNQEDLKGLPAKLQHQLTKIQDEMGKLPDPKCPPSSKAIQGLVKALEAYTMFVTCHRIRTLPNRRNSALDSLQDKIDSLKPKDKSGIRKFFHQMSSADSDREEIDSITQQLEEAHQSFMVRLLLLVFLLAYPSLGIPRLLH
jgi:hypothetical protein